MKHILLAVTGGIAAYKAIDLTSKLIQSGYDVRVMLSDHAQEFVTPLAFQAISRNPVYTNTFKEENPEEIQHVSLGDWADAIIVAPATANTIAKLSVGIADDLITSTLLATTTPKFVAPAMNVNMYNNPRTKHNMKVLSQDGYYFIEPGSGYLACGYVAKGRMEEPMQILSVINKFFTQQKNVVKSSFSGKRALVTAGPTVEVIDPVRYVSNRSSGKMGYAIAEALRDKGAIVDDMFQAVTERFAKQDIVIKAAAVSDYTPMDILEHKLKKQEGGLSVQFKRTKDILKYLGENKTHQYLVGFAAETQNIEQYALDKLKRKNADVIISNNVGDTSIGFSSDDNELTMHFKNNEKVNIKKGKKSALAHQIIEILETRWQ